MATSNIMVDGDVGGAGVAFLSQAKNLPALKKLREKRSERARALLKRFRGIAKENYTAI
jgi:hypothetical protein